MNTAVISHHLCVCSVSYTHLDVYKRQTQCVDYIYSHIKERITISDLAACTGLSESYLSRVFKQNPVSYTHLDVYKRQLVGFALYLQIFKLLLPVLRVIAGISVQCSVFKLIYASRNRIKKMCIRDRSCPS